MAIFSWFRLGNRSAPKDAAEEFQHFANEEAKRMRASDEPFDEDLHRQAVELVNRHLQAVRGNRSA
ncbi:MAG: hypothetical protein KDH88_18145 [Chromatiales bacterium]|nr:hypothetical protein [Chromatiales bacterium]